MQPMKQLVFFVFLSCFITKFVFASPFVYQRPQTYYDTLPNVKKGGMLTFRVKSDPRVMNPILSGDESSRAIEGFLWLSLMTVDGDNLNYLPSLANGFTVSEDKKDYTYQLNPNAKWQDGTSVTSYDVKYTFDTIMNPKVNAAAQRSYYSGISVSVKDPLTFTFHVEKPQFDSLFQLSLFVPIQKKQFENSKDFNKDNGILHPVGNGPYLLGKYVRGDKIVFQRNKNWWGYSLPHYKNRFNIDNVILKIIPSQSLLYEKFVHGDVDNVSFTPEQWETKVVGLDKEKYTSLFNKKPGKLVSLKIENKFPKSHYFIAWNEKNKIFNTVKTRTAISYLVNYPKILKDIFYNLDTQCTSPFGSFTMNSSQELRNSDRIISYNRIEAMALLKEDGWKNGGKGNLVKTWNGVTVPFIFSLNIPTQSQNSLKIAQILKEEFKVSGITLKINSMDWNLFLDKLDKREFDAALYGMNSTLFPNARQVWHSGSEASGGSNVMSYSNPKLDALIDESNKEFDPAKRNLMMQEITKIIYADQPVTFLNEGKFILEGLNPRIKSPKWLSDYSGGTDSDLFYLN